MLRTKKISCSFNCSTTRWVTAMVLPKKRATLFAFPARRSPLSYSVSPDQLVADRHKRFTF